MWDFHTISDLYGVTEAILEIVQDMKCAITKKSADREANHLVIVQVNVFTVQL